MIFLSFKFHLEVHFRHLCSLLYLIKRNLKIVSILFKMRLWLRVPWAGVLCNFFVLFLRIFMIWTYYLVNIFLIMDSELQDLQAENAQTLMHLSLILNFGFSRRST